MWCVWEWEKEKKVYKKKKHLRRPPGGATQRETLQTDPRGPKRTPSPHSLPNTTGGKWRFSAHRRRHTSSYSDVKLSSIPTYLARNISSLPSRMLWLRVVSSHRRASIKNNVVCGCVNGLFDVCGNDQLRGVNKTERSWCQIQGRLFLRIKIHYIYEWSTMSCFRSYRDILGDCAGFE